MRFKNALKIAFGNYALVFKDLLYKLIFFAIFSVVIGVIFEVGFRPVYNLAADFLSDGFSVFGAFVTGKEVNAAVLSEDLTEIMDYLSSHTGGLVASVAVAVFAFYVLRFFTGISDCVVMISVNGHMTSLSHRPYLALLFENLKHVIKYQLIEAFTAVIVTGAAVALAYVFIAFTSAFGVFLAVLFSIVIRGFYVTVMSRLMTNIVIDKMKFTDAVKNSFGGEKTYFWKMFAQYVTLTVVYVYAIVSAAVFTAFVGEFLLIPFFTLLLACMRQVDYFTVSKKKYFIDYDTIIVPKELRENDEKLLNDVDI